MTTATVTIPARFNGPPASGNGGYTCGAVARLLGGTSTVRLHRPPPLERPLAVRPDGEGVALCEGDTIVASGRRTRLRLDVPAPPTWAEAEAAAAAPAATSFHDRHPFPTCFTCGPARATGDGLRLFPGPVAGRDVWALPWTVPDGFADARGVLPVEVVWAVLDCPSSLPVMGPSPIVLGTLTASRIAEMRPGERLRICSWPIARDGRKRTSGVAVFDAADDLVAAAEAVWIELRR